MKFSVDTSGLAETLHQLEEDINEAIRPAAQAGAQLLYDNVKQNVSRIEKKTGRLSNSIYQAYSAYQSSDTKAVYEVSWNPRKAPHGHLVEYGHIKKYAVYLGSDGNWHTDKSKPVAPVQIAAKPFMRPAMTKFNEAMDAVKDRLIEELAKR